MTLTTHKVDTPKARPRRDETCICENCGVSFLWTIEEQHQKESAAPDFCPACQRLATPTARERGVVKWYDGRKHYGFIVRQKDDEIFTHRSQLVESSRLYEGDLVEFAVISSEKGLMASDVRVLRRANEAHPIVPE